MISRVPTRLRRERFCLQSMGLLQKTLIREIRNICELQADKALRHGI